MKHPYTEGDLVMPEDDKADTTYTTKMVNWGMGIIASLAVVFMLGWVTWVSVVCIKNTQDSAVLTASMTQKLDSLEKQMQENNKLLEQVRTNQVSDHYILREHVIKNGSLGLGGKEYPSLQ